MVGVARMALQGKAGTTVTIRYAEVLNTDGDPLHRQLPQRQGHRPLHLRRRRRPSTYEPTFTQHGFRYVEITGRDAPPALADVTGVVWGSDLPATGNLQTSDPMLNQLVSNISWGQRGNFLSIPTDTPARDERLGWTGDISVFAPTASYLRDTRAFLSKWMADMRDSQYANGDLPAACPMPRRLRARQRRRLVRRGITVPYAVWRAYGDARILRENYAAMQKFFDVRAHQRRAPTCSSPAATSTATGCNLDDPTPSRVIGTAYFAENARMMAEMAAALGETADAAEFGELSDDIRAAFTDASSRPTAPCRATARPATPWRSAWAWSPIRRCGRRSARSSSPSSRRATTT